MTAIKDRITSRARLVLCALAAVLTAASVMVHLGACLGVAFAPAYYRIFSLSFVIHGLIFIPFIAMVVQLKGGENRIGSLTLGERFNPAAVFKKFFPNSDYKIGIVLAVVFIYAFFNFYSASGQMRGGVPRFQDGEYVLSNHGKITVISEAQYVKARYLQLKAISGHWILFSFVPLLHFLDRRKGEGENKRESPPCKD